MKSTPIPYQKVPDLNELKSGFPTLKALFFDMDGTLFNTEGIHAEALMALATKYRIRSPYSIETVHALMIGQADHLVFEFIKDWEGIPTHWTTETFVAEKNQVIVDLLLNTDPAKYLSQAIRDLLKDIKNERLFLALVTSSEKIVTQKLLAATGLSEQFDLILTRDDCPLHKPDPWPYLKAREISGFENHEILIFEDSHVGLEAATHIGAHVIKVEWY